ncbi:MAG: hypothetical protein Kow0042_24640 [Calditrichia bacterium]
MKNKYLAGSSILAAIAASLCCITPVLAILGGLGGIASTFSWLEPLRPYLMGFTALLLGYAFYQAYKPKKETEIDCACEDEETDKTKNFLNSKGFLWVVLAVSIVLFAFPYYSGYLIPSVEKTNLVAAENNILEAEMQIEGMTCTGCEALINYALQSEQGVLKAESSYKTGIAHVKYDKSKVAPKKLSLAVEKLGYRVKDVKVKN